MLSFLDFDGYAWDASYGQSPGSARGSRCGRTWQRCAFRVPSFVPNFFVRRNSRALFVARATANPATYNG